MKLRNLFVMVLALGVLAMSGCSGGGGGGGSAGVAPAAPAAAPGNTIDGVASKGPLNGGTVKVYAIRNGADDRSVSLGQGQTGATGSYAINIGSYTGPVLLEVTGGSYTDEVSGTPVALNVPLRAMVSNAATGKNTVAVTALTELAYAKALGEGPLTAATIDNANLDMAATFKLIDIISTLPVAGGANEGQKQYAFALGSMAQFVNDNKNPGESLDDALVRLLTQIGDEMKNSGGFSIDTTFKMDSAITAFANGGNNQTGATITGLDTFRLKLNTSGIPNIMGAVDVTINFPAGVRVSADPITGETATAAVSISGVATVGLNRAIVGKFTPASGLVPGQLHLGLINATGFGLGEFARVGIELIPGGTLPANATAFSVAGFAAKDLNGSPLNGITAILK